jgi:hypothetical protein
MVMILRANDGMSKPVDPSYSRVLVILENEKLLDGFMFRWNNDSTP